MKILKNFFLFIYFLFLAFGCTMSTANNIHNPSPPPPITGARGVDETVVNHETKKCVLFHRGDACSPCDYTIQSGWVLAEKCPSNYTNYNDEQAFENYRELKSQALKCDKPRKVPKCCKEPPYCV